MLADPTAKCNTRGPVVGYPPGPECCASWSHELARCLHQGFCVIRGALAAAAGGRPLPVIKFRTMPLEFARTCSLTLAAYDAKPKLSQQIQPPTNWPPK